jgi:hypothetical protein
MNTRTSEHCSVPEYFECSKLVYLAIGLVYSHNFNFSSNELGLV